MGGGNDTTPCGLAPAWGGIKPFSLEEYLARVRALLRRSGQARSSQIQRGPLCVDLVARRAYWEGKEVELTGKEFALLEVLALSPERAFSPEELADRLFPGAESGTRIVRVYVHRLRGKLAPEAIATLPGGYRLGLSQNLHLPHTPHKPSPPVPPHQPQTQGSQPPNQHLNPNSRQQNPHH